MMVAGQPMLWRPPGVLGRSFPKLAGQKKFAGVRLQLFLDARLDRGMFWGLRHLKGVG